MPKSSIAMAIIWSAIATVASVRALRPATPRKMSRTILAITRSDAMETENIDKLFLELSQFTQARTGRELHYQNAMEKALHYLRHAAPRNGPVIQAIGCLQRALGLPVDTSIAADGA